MLELLRTRRSIRQFEQRAIPPEMVEQLVEAILRSPSSRGRNPWRIILVDERQMLENLSQCKTTGAQFLAGAALGIVVLGDEPVTDVWVEDCSIASAVAHFAAHSMGLGSCWIQVRNRLQTDGSPAEEYVKAALDVPEQFRVETIIAVGWPSASPPAHASTTLQRDKVFTGTFGAPFFRDGP